MNKINCNIVKDILPLYIDNVISDDTKELVEEHLLNCDECKKELSLLKSNLKRTEVVITEKDDIAFLKKIGLDIRKKTSTYRNTFSCYFSYRCNIIICISNST